MTETVMDRKTLRSEVTRVLWMVLMMLDGLRESYTAKGCYPSSPFRDTNRLMYGVNVHDLLCLAIGPELPAQPSSCIVANVDLLDACCEVLALHEEVQDSGGDTGNDVENHAIRVTSRKGAARWVRWSLDHVCREGLVPA